MLSASSIVNRHFVGFEVFSSKLRFPSFLNGNHLLSSVQHPETAAQEIHVAHERPNSAYFKTALK